MPADDADDADDAVRVNVICPGATDTPHLRQGIADSADPGASRRDHGAATCLGSNDFHHIDSPP